MFTTMSISQQTPYQTCRCCVKSCEEFHLLYPYRSVDPTDDLVKSLKLLVPELRLYTPAKPVICTACYKLLREAYSLRLRCLNSEKMINLYMQETHTTISKVQLHDVVKYCEGAFNPESKRSDPPADDVPEWFGSNDDEPEAENVQIEPEQSERELTYKHTNKSQSPTREVQHESGAPDANASKANIEKNTFVKERLSYINTQLASKNNPDKPERNNTTLSAEYTLEINGTRRAPLVRQTADKSVEDSLLTSKISPACQKRLTETGDKGFRVRNDLMNQAVKNNVDNIMKEAGMKKLGRPKLPPVPPPQKPVIIKRVIDTAKKRLLDQTVKETAKIIMKETKIIKRPIYFPEASKPKEKVNTNSGPSAPKPSTEPLILPKPTTQPSLARPIYFPKTSKPTEKVNTCSGPSAPKRSTEPLILPKPTTQPLILPKPTTPPLPELPENINFTPKNAEMDKEMLKVLQNSDLFREHVLNKKPTDVVSFVLRKLVNKDNRLLGYSVDMAKKAGPDTEDALPEVNSEILPEPEKNNESSDDLVPETPSTENPTAEMPRIRVRPVSSLQKIRTLNHELFPKTFNASAERDINFKQLAAPMKAVHLDEDRRTYLPSANQVLPSPKTPADIEVNKINMDPPRTYNSSLLLSKDSNGMKVSSAVNATQTPFVLNSMVANRKAPSPTLELSNAPIIPGLVPVTKEQLKRMGIDRICIQQLPPPTRTFRKILPRDEVIKIKEEPPEAINSEEISREDNSVNPLAQNELEDDIDIKEEPLNYEDDDDLMNTLESIDQDTLPTNPTTGSSETPLNSDLLEDTERNVNSPATESTRSASENPLDDETLDRLLGFGEIEQYDTPEFIQISKIPVAELAKFGPQQRKEFLQESSNSDMLRGLLANTSPSSDNIPAVPRRRRTKRLRIVEVDDEDQDQPTKKQRIQISPRRRTTTSAMNRTRIEPNSLDENIFLPSTKFTSQGDYINDHDYLLGPYRRYSMTGFQYNQPSCSCLLCDTAQPMDEHINHMQCHGTKCRICKLNFNNVFLLNLHVRKHIYRCPECKVNVTYARHAHHAKTHNSSPHLTNIDWVDESEVSESPQIAEVQQTSPVIRRRTTRNSLKATWAIEEDGKEPVTVTDGNQLQSEETPATNSNFSDKMGLVKPDDTNINIPSTTLLPKKKPRKSRKRKSKKRGFGRRAVGSQNNETVMEGNKVEDMVGICEVPLSDVVAENDVDKTANREAPESDVLPENNMDIIANREAPESDVLLKNDTDKTAEREVSELDVLPEYNKDKTANRETSESRVLPENTTDMTANCEAPGSNVLPENNTDMTAKREASESHILPENNTDMTTNREAPESDVLPKSNTDMAAKLETSESDVLPEKNTHKTDKHEASESDVVPENITDKTANHEASELDVLPRNITDKTANCEACVSEAVADNNAKESNVLEMKDNNLDENIPKQTTDNKSTDTCSNKLAFSGLLVNIKEENAIKPSIRRSRRGRSVNSLKSLSPSMLNTVKEEPIFTRRYPSRKSVNKTSFNTSLPSTICVKKEPEDTTTAFSSLDIITHKKVNKRKSRSKILKVAPENMANTPDDHPPETSLNPFVNLNLKQEGLPLSQKLLLKNPFAEKKFRPEADNAEDNVTSFEEKATTLNKKDCTETTENILSGTSSSQISDGSLNLVGNKSSTNDMKAKRQETLAAAAKEVLENGRTFRAVAAEYSINYISLHRYCNKLKKTGKYSKKIKEEKKQGHKKNIPGDKTKKPKKKSNRKSIKLEDGLSDDDDAICSVCAKKYSDSKPGEEWIRCTKCHEWAHEHCVNPDMYFICPKCALETNVELQQQTPIM